MSKGNLLTCWRSARYGGVEAEESELEQKFEVGGGMAKYMGVQNFAGESEKVVSIVALLCGVKQ